MGVLAYTNGVRIASVVQMTKYCMNVQIQHSMHKMDADRYLQSHGGFDQDSKIACPKCRQTR